MSWWDVPIGLVLLFFGWLWFVGARAFLREMRQSGEHGLGFKIMALLWPLTAIVCLIFDGVVWIARSTSWSRKP